MMTLKMCPSPTQEAFIRSTALENCLMGPRGEGKTEAGIMAMTYHAVLQDKSLRPIPWAIIRDTWSNLERTTIRSFLSPRPHSFAAQIRPYLKVRDGGRQLELPGFWVAYLFGIDSLGDLNKLQSLQLGGLWLEEAAPAAEDDIGSGVSADAWSIGITSLRAPVTTNRRAQITMNYPDEDHWTWIRFHEDSDPDRRLYRIKRGENRHIDSKYRENMAKALINRPDLYARLVEGRPSQVTIGEAVTPEYRPDIHRAGVVYRPLPSLPVYRFWDGGLNPTCVFAQITPRGRLCVLDTLRGDNIGMLQFIQSAVKPLISQRYSEIKDWIDIGDPALMERDQSDSSVTAAQIINSELNTSFEPGVSSWQARREAIKELLTRIVDGEPMFSISKHEQILHRALNGGWHYRKTPTGHVLSDKPVKDIHSHPADALSHGIAKIFQYGAQDAPKSAPQKNIAKTYAVKTPIFGRRGMLL